MNLALFEPNRSPLLPGQRWSIEQRDCFEWLRSLGSETVDLVVTDPAYESLEKHRKIGTTTRLTNAWFPIFGNELYPALFGEFYRVLRKNTHCYVMCDAETMFVIKPLAEEAGFKFWKPLVWSKVLMGTGYHYRASYEFVLFFEKGKRNLNSRSVKDVLEFRRVAGGQFDDDWRAKRAAIGGKAYPTEKPVGLSEVLISQSSAPGELVIDPFSGSGSVGEAALNLGRRFAGADVLESAVSITQARLGGICQRHN